MNFDDAIKILASGRSCVERGNWLEAITCVEEAVESACNSNHRGLNQWLDNGRFFFDETIEDISSKWDNRFC